MAGSRLHKVGDIFTRTTSLIRSGAKKREDRPLWYDVYEAFPPLQAPTYERSKPTSHNIRQIFYPEDVIRAKFYRKYGSPGTINLDESRSSKYPSVCESFVAAYQAIESTHEGLSPDQLMQEAEAALERQGIYADRNKRPRAAVQALDESIEEVLETQSAISSAALPGDLLKKINLADLVTGSKSSTSSESAGALRSDSTSTSAASNVAHGVAGSKNVTDGDSSSSNISVKEQKNVGSSSGT